MPKALITGITGQDGSYLAELLLSKGYEVHGIIRRASTFNTNRVDHIYRDPHNGNKAKMRLHYGDLSSSDSLQNIILEAQPDEIYNLAAQSHVRVSFDMPAYTGDVTGLGTIRLLESIVTDGSLQARAVVGLFPANSVGDDIELYDSPGRTSPLGRICTLRQQFEKPAGQPNYALADFVAPRDSGRIDTCGAFVVTAGHGLDALVAAAEADHDDYTAILLKALADRLAEAGAEYLHKQVRDWCGYGLEENLSPDDLIRERYRGIRPAPGYPACPDHTEKWKIFDLLEATARIGVTLTENLAMTPASSVSGLYLHHPESRYFAIGKINPDQVADYAARKAMSRQEVERWLAPILDYDPE